MVTASARWRSLVAVTGAGFVVVLACAPLFVGSWPGAARADTIMLRGGGQVEGKVVPDPKDANRVQVWLLQGRHPRSFQKAQILEVVVKASPLDDYLAKRKQTEETAQAQYDLGIWCEHNKLTDLSRVHFEAALNSDRSFAPAHQKLGHIYHNGYWLTRDELSAIQGLVKYKGRWITPHEKSKREDQEKVAATYAAWVRKIKQLRQAIVNGPTDRQREAEIQLVAIRDPEAIGPLLHVLGNDEPPLRILLAEALSAIPEPEATKALVRQILAEPTAEVRSVVFDKLKDRDDPGKVAPLVGALSSSNIPVINRAAWTLGNLGAIDAVPKLIPALLTNEQRVVIVPTGNQSSVGGPPGGMAPMALNGSSVAILTPPAVSQGVVAYGVMSAPYYASPIAPFNVGAQIQPRAEPRVVTFTFQNVEVLAALQKMTGQDFGYDVQSWRRWVSRKFNPNPKPLRRVPQP